MLKKMTTTKKASRHVSKATGSGVVSKSGSKKLGDEQCDYEFFITETWPIYVEPCFRATVCNF
jgi:hypothetical protein